MSGSKKRHVGRYVVLGFIIVLIIAGFFTYRALHKTSAGAVTYTTQAAQTADHHLLGIGNGQHLAQQQRFRESHPSLARSATSR